MMRYWSLERCLCIGIVVVVALLIAIVIDISTAAEVRVGTGIVVEKVYTPSSTKAGYGTMIGSRGNGTLNTVHTESETWIVIVSFRDETFAKRVNASRWAAFERGDPCDVFEKRGRVANYGFIVR